MHGLTVRWSLVDAAPEAAEALSKYVEGASHARFTGMEGLRFKVWRMRPGEWFEGCYFFDTDAARDAFQTDFAAVAADSPGSQLVGSAPILIEPCDVVAAAQGAIGFTPTATFQA